MNNRNFDGVKTEEHRQTTEDRKFFTKIPTENVEAVRSPLKFSSTQKSQEFPSNIFPHSLASQAPLSPPLQAALKPALLSNNNWFIAAQFSHTERKESFLRFHFGEGKEFLCSGEKKRKRLANKICSQYTHVVRDNCK